MIGCTEDYIVAGNVGTLELLHHIVDHSFRHRSKFCLIPDLC